MLSQIKTSSRFAFDNIKKRSILQVFFFCLKKSKTKPCWTLVLVSQNQRIVPFAVGGLRSPFAVVMHVSTNNDIRVLLVVAVPPSE